MNNYGISDAKVKSNIWTEDAINTSVHCLKIVVVWGRNMKGTNIVIKCYWKAFSKH